MSTATTQAFDSQNHLTSVVDPKGTVTEYPTDDFGNRAETISPDTGTATYLHDEAGNLVQQVDSKGTVINTTYDALNRLAAVHFPSDPGRNIAYTYDSASVAFGIGRLTAT